MPCLAKKGARDLKLSGVFRSLALRVVEARRHSYDGVVDLPAQVRLGGLSS